MNYKKYINSKNMPVWAVDLGKQLNRYKLVIAFLPIAAVYALLLLRIGTLNNAEPSVTQVNAQNSPALSARIDKKVIKQLQELQDNNVNVQTLFSQERDNPFQE